MVLLSHKENANSIARGYGRRKKNRLMYIRFGIKGVKTTVRPSGLELSSKRLIGEYRLHNLDTLDQSDGPRVLFCERYINSKTTNITEVHVAYILETSF